MKVASYNIMSGGFSSYNSSSSLPERLDLIRQAVKKINADFLSLIDTFRWDEIFAKKDLQKIFSCQNVYCINLNDQRLKKLGHNNGITVLTNLPVKKFQTIRLFNRDAIKTEVVFKNQLIDLFSLYLDDVSEETRVKQVKYLFKYLDRGNSTILMGDFNSLSQKDAPKIKQNEVIKIIEKAGFNDAGKTGGATVPTNLRLDYIFYSPNLKTGNFQVLKNSFLDRVSDHYPIALELR